MCPVRTLSWRQITNRSNVATRAYQSFAREYEKWLTGYDFVVVYHPGKTKSLDALWRLNSLRRQTDLGEKYDSVQAIVENCVPVALSLREIEEGSYSGAKRSRVKLE